MLIVLLLFCLMFTLILLGIPLVYSIGAASAFVLLTQSDMNLTFLAARMFKGVDSFVLTSIPFFLLAAEVLTSGGLVRRIIDFSHPLTIVYVPIPVFKLINHVVERCVR